MEEDRDVTAVPMRKGGKTRGAAKDTTVAPPTLDERLRAKLSEHNPFRRDSNADGHARNIDLVLRRQQRTGSMAEDATMLMRRSCVLTTPLLDESNYHLGPGEQLLYAWLDARKSNGGRRGEADKGDKGLSDPNSDPPSLTSQIGTGDDTLNSPDLSGPPSPYGSAPTPTHRMIETMMGVRNSSTLLRKAELQWSEVPKHILVLKKPHDDDVHTACVDIVEFLLLTRPHIHVHVEAEVIDGVLADVTARLQAENTPAIRKRIKSWSPKNFDAKFLSGDADIDIVPDVDLVVTLGGDGTFLHAAHLFQLMAPPVMSFAMGSLGFLTPFNFMNHKQHIDEVLDGVAVVTLRTRIECQLIKVDESGDCDESKSDGLFENVTNVMNEIVVDRGPSSALSMIDLYADGSFMTCVQGDGIIIATPTGSTAYSVAAGGSMVHPIVPCILITPICPHSLSFRPIILPATTSLTVVAARQSRGSAWAAMDGKNRRELKKGMGLRITTSVWPVPTINNKNQTDDWLDGLGTCLHWNQRERQKPSKD
eukprot:m.302625 g.302625  ORF g.302625 m.302625 type:complete len:536 (-) comp20148_c0_seq1:372-1979(-)